MATSLTFPRSNAKPLWIRTRGLSSRRFFSRRIRLEGYREPRGIRSRQIVVGSITPKNATKYMLCTISRVPAPSLDPIINGSSTIAFVIIVRQKISSAVDQAILTLAKSSSPSRQADVSRRETSIKAIAVIYSLTSIDVVFTHRV